ncbi:MAG: type II toxin-antitoxin system VapC family toxin [Spirochaetales bacterium]|nr:type II toxin-antitoxin system VapC family toxin [Spirochaetales bacterium]
MYILDTLPLIYWTLDPIKLPEPVKEVLLRAKDLYISSISLWEMGMMKKKGYLELPLGMREFQIRLEKTSRVTVLDVDESLCVKALDLDFRGDDICDRLIITTAMLNNLTLITQDQQIQNYYPDHLWKNIVKPGVWKHFTPELTLV